MAELQSAVGCLTVIVSAANAPPLAAVTTAVPGATPVTSPADETVATDAGALAHVTLALGMAWPWKSVTVAESCTVAPGSTVGLRGVTVTDATIPSSSRNASVRLLLLRTPAKPAGTVFRSFAFRTTRMSAKPICRAPTHTSAR